MGLRPVVLVVLLALVFAGCVQESDPGASKADTDKDDEWGYGDDRINIRSINDSALDWVPTLEEPPEWTLGQWWKIQITEEFTGKTFEAYRVVAGQEDDFWLVGMPYHDFSNALMVLHLPGFGQVTKDTLAFEAHDVWFEPIRFPVVEDENWTTGFQTADNVECSVMSVDGLEASIECFGGYHMVIDYDAEMRAIKRLEVDGYASYEIVEHGYAFHEDLPELEGVVTVPHMSDLIFFHGRLGGAVQISPQGMIGDFGVAPAPMEQVEIDSTYDRVSFSLILGDILRQGLPPAYYQETATAPDGETYESVLTAADGDTLTLTSFKHDDPGGTWDLQHIAAGPGVAFIEGIGYHVYDIELPSGHIRPSVGEHQHGSDDGH